MLIFGKIMNVVSSKIGQESKLAYDKAIYITFK